MGQLKRPAQPPLPLPLQQPPGRWADHSPAAVRVCVCCRAGLVGISDGLPLVPANAWPLWPFAWLHAGGQLRRVGSDPGDSHDLAGPLWQGAAEVCRCASFELSAGTLPPEWGRDAGFGQLLDLQLNNTGGQASGGPCVPAPASRAGKLVPGARATPRHNCLAMFFWGFWGPGWKPQGPGRLGERPQLPPCRAAGVAGTNPPRRQVPRPWRHAPLLLRRPLRPAARSLVQPGWPPKPECTVSGPAHAACTRASAAEGQGL